MIGALLTGLWRLAVSLLFWWLYLVKHSAMHGLCHCLELFINSMWWVYRVHSFHKDILLIATSNCRLVRSVGCVPYSAKQRFMDSASTEALLPCPVYPSLRKYYCLKGGQGCALAKASCPWCLTFVLGHWEIISQVQSSGLSTIFPRVQPFSCLKAVEQGCGLSSICTRCSV